MWKRRNPNHNADTCISVAAPCDHMNIQISHRNALEEKEKSRLDLDSLEPSDEDALGDIEGVEDEDMVVVLGKGDHITLAGDLQTATAGDLIKYIHKTCQLKSDLDN